MFVGKGASSLLEPNFNFFKLFSHSARVEIVDKIKLSSSSIDEMNINDIDFIKMDIQGAELMTLKVQKNQLEKFLEWNWKLNSKKSTEINPYLGDLRIFKRKGF